jgi:tetratricopeptide (TPR) repeat protein
MSGSTGAARTQAKETVDLIDRSDDPGIMLPFFHRRLRSRAVLVQANVEILEGKANYWERVQGLLEEVLREDPRYYYAIVTVAQAYTGAGQPDKAKDLFRRAYQTIQTSNDLLMVTEVRSEALLRMTAGLCCRQTEDLPSAEEHLEKTSQLLDMLPSRDSARCSVFSVLSKRNESMDVISLQLDWIRNGLTAPP